VTLALRYGARSDVGLLRDGNEDAMYAGPRLLAVADGMGGHAAGEVASRIAIETVAGLDLDPPGSDLITALKDAVDSANGYLRDMVAADNALEGMGTTLTALLSAGQRLGLVHVGDSRAYLLRAGTLQQITHDHTLVQNLVDEGRISPEEASTHPQRSWITRALDGRGEVELDLSVREARAGDRYLLCTDGLSGVVSEETMREALSLPDPQEACDRLVDLALRAGGPDNITCIVADIVDEPAPDEEPIVGGAAADAAPVARTEDSPASRAAQMNNRGNHRATADTVVDEAADDDSGESSERRSSRRLAYLLVAVVVVVALGVLGSWLYIRTQFFVGTAKGSPSTVGLFRGVSGSVLGIDLSSLDERTDVPTTALPDFERTRVESGIDAKSHDDARRIVSQLRAEACAQAMAGPPATAPTLPPASPSPSPSRSAAAKNTPSASPTPTPTPPAYCKGAP
jgi:serine/threonine protein phosphatase PrpC